MAHKINCRQSIHTSTAQHWLTSQRFKQYLCFFDCNFGTTFQIFNMHDQINSNWQASIESMDYIARTTLTLILCFYILTRAFLNVSQARASQLQHHKNIINNHQLPAITNHVRLDCIKDGEISQHHYYAIGNIIFYNTTKKYFYLSKPFLPTITASTVTATASPVSIALRTIKLSEKNCVVQLIVILFLFVFWCF